MGFILDCMKLHLKELIIKMNEKDYHEFLQISNEYGLSVEEKIYEIYRYDHIISSLSDLVIINWL